MIAYPNAKINLGLNILSKRGDGYHDIESVMYPVPWRDILEIVESADGLSGQVTFTTSGISVPDDGKPNLCERAYRSLSTIRELPAVRIHLHKQIPMGAGLGGGSADAAFVLSVLNELFGIGLSQDRLHDLAAELGSDCPFFIENSPKLVSGRGEVMADIGLSLTGKKLLIVYPGIHIGTAEAYAGVRPSIPAVRIAEILKMPIGQWKDQLGNDFETSIFRTYPTLALIKQTLYDHGAVYSSMSGSGSAIYGIFDERLDFALPEDLQCKWTDL